ncbi:hypothetical protein CRUP_032827 [Coryphaenoides rupestris]|nr:hypothetical protein CRUP_032827 [Coryphaenoides rupestris]
MQLRVQGSFPTPGALFEVDRGDSHGLFMGRFCRQESDELGVVDEGQFVVSHTVLGVDHWKQGRI